MTSLSPEQVERYRRDGYLFPLPALTPDEAMHYRQQLEKAEALSGEEFAKAYRHKPYLVFGWAAELIRQKRILDAIEGIIGPDILCWEVAVFTKPAQSDAYISWHQDITYWGLEAEGNVVTAWLALSPSTVESGCMRVVPGTHKREVVPHTDTFADKNLLSRGQEIAVEVDEVHAVDLILAPGEMSLHHVKIFHGSNPNHSHDRRIGFAIRYIPPSLRQAAGARDSACLVRGEDRFGHFEHEEPASDDLSDAAIANHARLYAQRRQIMMRTM